MLYDYVCPKCEVIYEVRHGMNCEDEYECPKCRETLKRKISSSFYISGGMGPTLEDIREENHHKKVKDPERAEKMRRKAFGGDGPTNVRDKPDPRHIIKGKTLGGQQMEVDKGEMIKALAKDDFAVQKSLDVIKKQK